MEDIYKIYDIMDRLGMKSPYGQLIEEAAGKAAKQIINEKINLDRIIKKHGDNGFIAISASRSSQSEIENKTSTEQLMQDIKNSGYSYLPSYGGYHNVDTGEEADFEASFIVFNYKHDKNNKYSSRPFDELVEIGKEWCKKYDQDCILVKYPHQAAIYMNRFGKRVSRNEKDEVVKNSSTQEYFTSLKSREEAQEEMKQRIMYYYKKYRNKQIGSGCKALPFSEWFKEWMKNDGKREYPSFIGRRWSNVMEL